MKDGGLMAGGAGSVNFWTSRKMAANGLTNLLSTVVGGVLTPAERRWCSGTRARMMKRLYARHGPPTAVAARGAARVAHRRLSEVGRSERLRVSRIRWRRRIRTRLMWGDVSKWTADQEIDLGRSRSTTPRARRSCGATRAIDRRRRAHVGRFAAGHRRPVMNRRETRFASGFGSSRVVGRAGRSSQSLVSLQTTPQRVRVAASSRRWRC